MPPSTNVEDQRAAPKPQAPTANPFSYASSRDKVDPSKGYNGASPDVNIPNNPFQPVIDALTQMGQNGHQHLIDMIGQSIGQLGRKDENGYNIRSRAPTGALRPNTRSN